MGSTGPDVNSLSSESPGSQYLIPLVLGIQLELEGYSEKLKCWLSCDLGIWLSQIGSSRS